MTGVVYSTVIGDAFPRSGDLRLPLSWGGTPNWLPGVGPLVGHPDAALVAMKDRLKAIYVTDLEAKKKTDIVNLLKDFAQEYFERKLPGMR